MPPWRQAMPTGSSSDAAAVCPGRINAPPTEYCRGGINAALASGNAAAVCQERRRGGINAALLCQAMPPPYTWGA